MVALKLMNFGGMLPAVDARLLPQNNAELSENTWIYSGAVEGLPLMTQVRTLSNPNALRAFRIPFQNFGKDNIPDSYWLEFATRDMTVVASPITGDTYQRFYWAGFGTEPRYNTRARIASASASFKLGIPAPTVAPTVTPAGGVAPTETRAYVYTWVSAYGEEGPPSPPTVVTGNANATWDLTLTAPGAAATDRNLATVRIYRTITGTTGSTTYYLVASQAIATTTYADTVATTTVAASNVLESIYWTEPPSDLLGFVSMPNGMIAAWRANEVWFCEPYRPHAWPSMYTLSVEGDVVGLGVFGQSVVVCTTISPYVISGVNPSGLSMTKLATIEPCQSRGSIVSTASGVVYASQNGLISVSPAGVQNMTRQIITKNKWLDATKYLNVSTLRAALLGDAYYCWGAPSTGCFEPSAFDNSSFLIQNFTGSYNGAIIDITDGRVGWVNLTSATPTDNCWIDEWTGEILVVRSGKVYWFDLAPGRTRGSYLWRSKVFETPNQRNFGAMRVYLDYAGRSATPIATLKLYGDGVLRMTRSLYASGDIVKPPSGYKATFWQVEVASDQKLLSIELATAPKELGSV